MRATIIIPAYNAAATLDECLRACTTQRGPECEIIVVDDGSTDATGDIARRYPVRYFYQENAGPAAARNHGAREARGDIFAFTDADCVPQEDWIEQLVSAFDADMVAAAGGTYGIMNPSNLLARLIHDEIRYRHDRQASEVDFLGSFNVAYHRSYFERAGGFDESYTMASGEDNDLAYRIHDLGGILRFVPQAVVGHYHPEKLSSYLRTQRWHGYWRVKLYRDHPHRTKGDTYAPRADLLAPIVVLLTIASFPIIMIVLPLPGIGLIAALLLYAEMLIVITLQFPLVFALCRYRRAFSSYLYLPLLTLRSIARALGLAHGILAFGLKRNRI